jgi:S-methylmethionine-dependent homocysteine/selenocysteine methylase
LQDGYREELTPEKYGELANEWVKSGATILGGCCGIFPEHIKCLHNLKQ